MNGLTLAITLTLALWWSSAAEARKPGRSNAISAHLAVRKSIKSQHILDRPYRLGHFYGNTVRRRYHRGATLLLPRNQR